MSVFKTQRTLGTEHCFIIGVPKSIWEPLVHDVNRWLVTNGTEWTVNRIKEIKNDFIRLKAGLEPVSLWIAINRKKGSFKGPFGSLQRWSSFNYKRWSKAIVMLQMYTQFISPSVTPAQEKKFLDGINAVDLPQSEEMLRIYDNVAIATRLFFKTTLITRVPKPLVSIIPSSTRREPHASGKSFPEGKHTLECAASYLYGTKVGHELRRVYKRIFSHVLPGFRNIDERDTDYVSTVVCEYDNCVGKIGLIQEPGYKLRSVANPARVYQAALGPLGDDLYDRLKSLPWDCTHDQTYPFNRIRQCLTAGQMVHSVDLSSATDFFPLSLQLVVLRSLYHDSDYVDLFRDLSKASWLYKNDKHVRWKKGQPLGLFPSFATFAMTHGLLLFSLNDFQHSEKFYVLGDDVVILDDNLHKKYKSALNMLGCPISENKSISSSSLCEFAGKILTPECVVSPTKWRSPTDDSFVDFVANFGRRAYSMLKPRQLRVIKTLAEVPDFMGGLGFNPDGIPLQERINKYMDLYMRDSSRSYFMSYNRLVNANLYASQPFGFSFRSFHHGEVTLDQSVIDKVTEHLPTLLMWYSVLGKNLYSIQPDLHLALDQPSGRRTRLEIYETMFF
jgi:hypothetical protein